MTETEIETEMETEMGEIQILSSSFSCTSDIFYFNYKKLYINIYNKEHKNQVNRAMGLMTGKCKASRKIGLMLKMDKIFSRQPSETELAEKGWLEKSDFPRNIGILGAMRCS